MTIVSFVVICHITVLFCGVLRTTACYHVIMYHVVVITVVITLRQWFKIMTLVCVMVDNLVVPRQIKWL